MLMLICSNIHINIDVYFNDMQLNNTPQYHSKKGMTLNCTVS